MSHIIIVYNGRRIIAPRPMTYEAAVTTTRTLFPSLSESLSFQTDELDICDAQLAEISPGVWESVIGLIKSITVVEITRDAAETSLDPISEPRTTPDRGVSSDSEEDTLTIRIMGERREIKVQRSDAPNESLLQALLAERLGTNPADYELIEHGTRYWNASSGGDVIEYRRRPATWSPAIYLRSSKTVRATVSLSLAPHWSFSGTGPTVPIKDRTATTGESLTWKIVVHSGGFLTDQESGRQLSRLSWQTQWLREGSVDSSSSATDLRRGSITNENGVLLDNRYSWGENPIQKYVEKIFTAFDIPQSIQSNFSSALRSISKTNFDYVALTVLTKEQLSRSAPLQIVPSPDDLKRIFILYRYVPDNEVDRWPEARTRGADFDISLYLNAIGIGTTSADSGSEFRVIELGAMEVTE